MTATKNETPVADERKHLSDAAIREIAHRLDLTEIDVRNVISYYLSHDD